MGLHGNVEVSRSSSTDNENNLDIVSGEGVKRTRKKEGKGSTTRVLERNYLKDVRVETQKEDASGQILLTSNRNKNPLHMNSHFSVLYPLNKSLIRPFYTYVYTYFSSVSISFTPL